ncbi:MAG: pirin family protein [Thiotrichales bacterium]
MQIIEPVVHDLGDGFSVRRALPNPRRRMIGPFIFWDHFGPVTLTDTRKLSVRPHPHCCLATVTYLFAGEILHRDSLGNVLAIRPGEVNLMTAGRGIVHSERCEPASGETVPTEGIQLWLALPLALEETEPAFAHYAADALPRHDAGAVRMKLIMGECLGLRSPVYCHSPTFYADLSFEREGTAYTLPVAAGHAMGVYVASGEVTTNGVALHAGQLGYLADEANIAMRAGTRARVLVFGGEPFAEPRHIWWNFVASDRERIERAKADWREGRFPAVPGEVEFIPLPDERG